MATQNIQIPDDPKVVQPIFKELKENFKTGGTRSVEARKQNLSRLLEGFEAMKQDFAEAHYKDLGINSFIYDISSHGVTVGEIKDCLSSFKCWMKPQSVPTPLAVGMAKSYILYEPLGVVLVISAWNYPVYTAIPLVAAAMAAGNSVILKPSQLAPHTSKALKKLFQKYLDPKYFRVIEGKVQVAKAVSRLPFDLICFTGSTTTGRLVAIEGAKNLTPCILQLGGKCPIIVDQSAKIQSAVLRIMLGKYLNCGQTCVGVDHVYIHESIYEQFKKLLVSKVDAGYGQQSKDQQDGHYGKIVNNLRINRLEELLNDNHGGKILYGGNVNKEKLYIAPTIVEQPKKDSLMMSEEIFGPIMPIFSYNNLNEVIRQINDRPKPLVVYVFSQNSSNIKKIRDETFSGAFVVNEAVMQMANNHLPFGGVGMSGYGRYHGKSGFVAFSNPKSVCETQAFNPYPINCKFPPYNEKGKSMILKLMKIGSVTDKQLKAGVLVLVVLIVLILIFTLVVIPRINQ